MPPPAEVAGQGGRGSSVRWPGQPERRPWQGRGLGKLSFNVQIGERRRQFASGGNRWWPTSDCSGGLGRARRLEARAYDDTVPPENRPFSGCSIRAAHKWPTARYAIGLTWQAMWERGFLALESDFKTRRHQLFRSGQ